MTDTIERKLTSAERRPLRYHVYTVAQGVFAIGAAAFLYSAGTNLTTTPRQYGPAFRDTLIAACSASMVGYCGATKLESDPRLKRQKRARKNLDARLSDNNLNDAA